MAFPQHLVEDLLLRYADIVRVGHLLFNGESLVWSTNGNTQRQLEAFVTVFLPKLRSLPEVGKALDDEAIFEMLLNICKAVSINFVLFDVLNLLKHKTGKPCTIETRSQNGGNCAEYFVNTSPGLEIEAGIAWDTQDNIFACIPGASKKTNMGTLSKVQVHFSLLPASKLERPACSVSLNLRPSLLKLMLTLGCKKSGEKCEVIHLDEPLCLTNTAPAQIPSAHSEPEVFSSFGKSTCSDVPRRSRSLIFPSKCADREGSATCRRSLLGKNGFMKLIRRRRPADTYNLLRRE